MSILTLMCACRCANNSFNLQLIYGRNANIALRTLSCLRRQPHRLFADFKIPPTLNSHISSRRQLCHDELSLESPSKCLSQLACNFSNKFRPLTILSCNKTTSNDDDETTRETENAFIISPACHRSSHLNSQPNIHRRM